MFKTNLYVMAAAGLAVLAGAFPGCTATDITRVSGSGTIKEYHLTVSDFSQVAVTGPIPVNIRQAEKCTATLKINDNLYSYVRVTQVIDVLRVELEPASFRNLDISLDITAPSLRSLAITRAGSCVVHEFNLKETCDITVSEASTADISLMSSQYVSVFATSASTVTGTLNCADARLAASGASRLFLKGQCEYAIIDAAGASQLELADCWIGNAEAMVRGVSTAFINVGGKLSVNVSGASTLSYSGNPGLGKVTVAAGSKLQRR